MKKALLVLAAAAALAPSSVTAQADDARIGAAYPSRTLCVHALSSLIWDTTYAARLAGERSKGVRQELKRTYSCYQLADGYWYLLPG